MIAEPPPQPETLPEAIEELMALKRRCSKVVWLGWTALIIAAVTAGVFGWEAWSFHQMSLNLQAGQSRLITDLTTQRATFVDGSKVTLAVQKREIASFAKASIDSQIRPVRAAVNHVQAEQQKMETEFTALSYSTTNLAMKHEILAQHVTQTEAQEGARLLAVTSHADSTNVAMRSEFAERVLGLDTRLTSQENKKPSSFLKLMPVFQGAIDAAIISHMANPPEKH